MRNYAWVLVSLLSFLGCGDNGGETFDSTVEIPGLEQSVAMYTDSSGVLHLKCKTDTDCFAAQGYFHAAHRFSQMDISRRLARGKLSEIAGALTVGLDTRWRSIISTIDGGSLEDQMWDASSQATKDAITAYTMGVNAWIADLRAGRNGATLAAEYGHPAIDQADVADWDVKDSVACFLPLLDSLTNSSAEEINYGQLYAELAAGNMALAADLINIAPSSPSTTLPSSETLQRVSPAPNLLQVLELLKKDSTFRQNSPQRSPVDKGSNNWVVSPSKSAGGALLANDPHLGLSNPAIWYLVHLENEEGGLHVAGASFAGLPGILFGQNQHLAWGVTTTYFDQSDVYIETLTNSGSSVSFNGNDVDLIERQFDIEVKDAATQTVTVKYVPHHGPIISEEGTSALSVRWTGQDASTDFNFMTEMMLATDIASAKTALRNVTTAGQNFVVIDTAGDIGWFPYNKLPKRPWASPSLQPWLPLPGDGSAEWTGYVAYDDLPQAENPTEGYLATANNDMTGALADGDVSNDGYEFMQSVTAEGYRHEQIIALLAANDAHTPMTMSQIQGDNVSLLAKETLPALLTLLGNESLGAGAQNLKTKLENWDYRCTTGLAGTDPEGPASEDATNVASAEGCAAFHYLWYDLRDRFINDDISDVGPSIAVSGFLKTRLLAKTLRTPASVGDYWDDASTGPTETPAEVIAASMEATVLELESDFGSDPWLWGREHVVALRSDLFSSNGVQDFDNGPFANDGGLFTVDVANPSSGFQHYSGPSIRWVCEANDTVACTFELPGGQRHFADDPFYDNLLEDWLNNTPRPMIFDMKQARSEAVEKIQLAP